MTQAEEPGFRVDKLKAFAVGGWSEDLGRALRRAQPASMELQGQVHDLSKFAGVVDSVTSLRLAGSAATGRIDSVSGLEVFSHLQSLEILAPVRRLVVASELPQLTRCSLVWQASCEVIACQPTLRSLSLTGFGGTSLEGAPFGKALNSLWLNRPGLVSLAGLGKQESLSELRLTNAKALTSLDGASEAPLASVDIEGAPALRDITALEGLKSLQRVRLVGTSELIDLGPLSNNKSLKRLHAGGPRMPALDWRRLITLPAVEFISGGWNPDELDEAHLRTLVPVGRRMVRFSPVGKRGVRPLVVELADG